MAERERDINAEGETPLLWAVVAAKKSIITAAVQEFGVDMTNKRPFQISAHLV